MLCFNDKYIDIIFVIFWDFKKVYVIYLEKIVLVFLLYDWI